MQTLIEALRSRHDGAARGFAAALSGLLRSPVDVKLTGIDEPAFIQLAHQIEYPTCLNVLRADPLPGQNAGDCPNFLMPGEKNVTVPLSEAFWLLEIKLDILFPIIDRLLGGGR